MANLTASDSSSPWVMWNEVPGGPPGIDPWRITGTGSELDFSFYGVAGIAWVTKMKLEPSSKLSIVGSNPRLILEDTSSSSSDFTLGADANLWTLTQDSTVLLEASTTEIVSKQDIRIKSTAPKLVFEDTTSSAESFTLKADADRLELSQSTGTATLVRFYKGGDVNFHDASTSARVAISPNTGGDALVRAGDATEGVRGVFFARRRPDTTASGIVRIEADDGQSVFLSAWLSGGDDEIWATQTDPGSSKPTTSGPGTGNIIVAVVPS